MDAVESPVTERARPYRQRSGIEGDAVRGGRADPPGAAESRLVPRGAGPPHGRQLAHRLPLAERSPAEVRDTRAARRRPRGAAVLSPPVGGNDCDARGARLARRRPRDPRRRAHTRNRARIKPWLTAAA